KVWNRWREDNPEVTPNLSETRLYDLDLEGVNLSSADLSNTFILDCNLSNVIFNAAILLRVRLSNVRLFRSDLRRSTLSSVAIEHGSLEEATIADTTIGGVDFYAIDLKNTDFSNAVMYANSFINVDLSVTKGLKSIFHGSPSTIGIDTLYKSAGKIPEIFLRGCGVPDDFITFIPSLIGAKETIQFYSCFISYSTKDEEFARRLYSRMRDEKLRVWFAPEDIKGGEKLFEQIERAIQVHDRLLIILSEESMKSNWVIEEIRNALRIEAEQDRRKLFPISLVDFDAIKKWKCFDSDIGKDLAVELREYYIPDFSDWKNHDSFEKGFARLLQDLRAEEEKQAETRQ
ncbi:MAG TPA: toll/interleukin-1 receptor domain-containing protein, partial [Pyrinomonadaceae bacterium]